MKRIIPFVLAGLLAIIGGDARAASVPPVNAQQCQIPAACIDLNAALSSINQNVSGYQSLDFIDNGAFLVNQRGTGIATGGTTSGPAITAQVSDRWMVECNVTSCAPRGQVVTSVSGVTLQGRFANAISLYRNSGALTQPICLEQEIESSRATQLSGLPVILSAWIAQNAAFSGTAQLYVWTGTGTDQGLGSLRSAVGMTASPALTPAWTTIATPGAVTTAALTSTTTRYNTGQVQIPAGTTEIAVGICFTPAAETAGTTDGIVIQGAQLEEADPNQIAPGRFNRPPVAEELLRAQRFYVEWDDNLAATFQLPGTCFEITSGTTAACTLNLPVPQALAAPVSAVGTATSFGMTKVADGTAEACTTLAVVASSNTPSQIGLTCAVSETAAVGTGHIMLYANTGATHTLTVNSAF